MRNVIAIIATVSLGFYLFNEPETNQDQPAQDRPAYPVPGEQYQKRTFTPIERTVDRSVRLALGLIKRWERFSSTPYYCAAGVKTIGYGDTDPVLEEREYISEEEAEQYLIDRVEAVRSDIQTKLRNPVSDTQLAALISFYYNLGPGNFDNIAKRINNGDVDEAADAIVLYDKCNGKTLKGLTSRRLEEQTLFNNL